MHFFIFSFQLNKIAFGLNESIKLETQYVYRYTLTILHTDSCDVNHDKCVPPEMTN